MVSETSYYPRVKWGEVEKQNSKMRDHISDYKPYIENYN